MIAAQEGKTMVTVGMLNRLGCALAAFALGAAPATAKT
jgi:hypothetical protein